MFDILKKIWLLFLICAFFIMVFLMYKSDKQQTEGYRREMTEIYGTIQFKGKVIQLHKIRRNQHINGLICIKLDSTNTDSFYKFYRDKFSGPFSTKNVNSCFKIKAGIATLPTGSLSDNYSKRVIAILNARYVEVNMNDSRQVAYIDSAGNRYVTDLYYGTGDLIEADMSVCDECE